MGKMFLLIMLSVVLFAESNLPNGAIKRGSLANAKLIQDTKLGVVSKVAIMGCKKPESYEPFVLAMPIGKVGARIWKELWIVQGCNSKYPVEIMFSEDGIGAANWSIDSHEVI